MLSLWQSEEVAP